MVLQEIGSKKLNAKFFVRILPGLEFASDSIKIQSNAKAIHVKCLQTSTKKNKNASFWCFPADYVFWNKCQDEIYQTVCGNLIENAVKGVSGLLMAYGQTGSGKTFTISGLRYHFQNRGLILRLLSALCGERASHQHLVKFSISVSYVEFTHTKMKDLFRNKFIDTLKDVKKCDVTEEEETWKLIFEAEVRKTYNEGSPYLGSHKGHTVFTIHFESTSLVDSNPLPTKSKIHIVDLAGIDCAGNTPSAWKSNSDLGYSNLTKSLMEQLILCITGKTWKVANRNCPYKSMKLLEYLKDTLQPYCMVRFIGHIFGNEENLPVTLSVLRFGMKIRCMKPSKLHQEVSEDDPEQIIKILQSEVSRLKAEVELNEMLTDSPNFSNLSQENLQMVRDIRRMAKSFLTGETEDLALLSLGQAEITLEVFKDLYEKLILQKDQAVKEAVIHALEEVHNQQVTEKSFSRPMSSSQVKASRRRSSRQQETRSSPTAPMRPSDTSIGSRKQLASTFQVGVLDKRGIGLGTGRSSTAYEGPAAKALKRVRSRKSDSAVKPAPRSDSMKDRGVPSSKDILGGECPLLPEKVPTKEEAWQEFCKEKCELIQMYQEDICSMEECVRGSRKIYINALCDLVKQRDGLEKFRREWEEWKNVQHLLEYGGGNSDLDTIKEEATMEFYEDGIEKKEIELNNAVEACHVALIEFRNGIEDLGEIRATFEEEFQNFCSETYKIPMLLEDSLLQQMPLVKSSSTLAREEAANQERMELYYHLQHKMLNYIPKARKQEWVTRF